MAADPAVGSQLEKADLSASSSLANLLGVFRSTSHASPRDAISATKPSSVVTPMPSVGGDDDDDARRGSDLDASGSESEGEGQDILALSGIITSSKVTSLLHAHAPLPAIGSVMTPGNPSQAAAAVAASPMPTLFDANGGGAARGSPLPTIHLPALCPR